MMRRLGLPRWAALLFAVLPALALGFFVWRGIHRYDPPSYSGPECRITHRAALDILEHGTTAEDYHPTGVYYYVAAIYEVLPKHLASVVAVNILLLPLLPWLISRMARRLGGDRAATFGFVLGASYYPFAFFAATPHGTSINILAMALAIDGALALLDDEEISWKRALVTGVALGVAAALKPYFGLLGVSFAAAVLAKRRALRPSIALVAPVAAASLLILVGMTAANPPKEGTSLRGGQGAARSLLMGTYQYEYQWWDWQPFEESDEPGSLAYRARLAELEAQSGKPMSDPATSALIFDEVVARTKARPLYVLKKFAVSIVRVWILTPTFLSSLVAKLACTGFELGLLGLGLFGLWLHRQRSSTWWFPLTLLLLPSVMHMPFHVEARYSMPLHPLELALAGVALASLVQRREARVR